MYNDDYVLKLNNKIIWGKQVYSFVVAL